jgi:hypothetical protein
MGSAVRICSCGLIKQKKAGAVVIDGVEFCNACHLPVTFSQDAVDAAARYVVEADHVTTLQSLPGYRIARVLGVVTELSATSGLTATIKGNNALESGMAALRRSAADIRPTRSLD